MEFEWDGEKAQANVKKHAVVFAEATATFGDPFQVSISDPDHSIGEQRFLSKGMPAAGRILVVSYVEHSNNRIRIIRTVIHIRLPTEPKGNPVPRDSALGAWQGNSRQRPKCERGTAKRTEAV